MCDAMTDYRAPQPELAAFRVQWPGGGENLVAWCPWCLETHSHGVGGGYGHRVAHCFSGTGSPFAASGYSLVAAGDATDAARLRPKAIFARADFAKRLARADLARRMLGALLNARVGIGLLALPRARLAVAGARWELTPAAAPPIEGSGLLDLLCQLFGVPPGVAAVRILEAVTRIKFDGRAALEIAHAVDCWIRRGATSTGRA
jgi:hypothetical protein